MNNKISKKIVIALCILSITRILVIVSFDFMNKNTTEYINIENNVIYIDGMKDNSAKTLLIKSNVKNMYEFYVKSKNREDISLIYEDAEYEYSIYIRDRLKIQNYYKEIAGYSSNTAYQEFCIKKDDYKYEDGYYITKIRLETYNKVPMFFLGKKKSIDAIIHIRTIYNTLILIVYSMVFIISSFFYKLDKARYMLICIIIGLVSIFKCIISGELYIFSRFIGINSYYFIYYERITHFINYFLYQSLLYTLYDFNIKKKYISAYINLYIVMLFLFVFKENEIAFFILYYSGAIFIVYINVWAYIKEKSYGLILLWTYSIFAGLNFYNIFMKLDYFKKGYISSIFNGPQLGSVIYVFGFLCAVINTYFSNIRQYKEKQKEYERLQLLRGIGHDLKLPLSIIKLNNQMMKKYDMNKEDRDKYINNNLEAVSELEKMTSNISSYINMKDSNIQGYTASIKESFMKVKNHYSIYKEKNIDFEVICDERDILLPINNIQLDRMLYNLVDNAFKYNKYNGKVKLEYIVDKDLIITIQDTGVGMDEEEIDNIFTPFYRVDYSRTREGMGLGLSVVKEIVESMNANIEINSKKGTGTKIIIRINLTIW